MLSGNGNVNLSGEARRPRLDRDIAYLMGLSLITIGVIINIVSQATISLQMYTTSHALRVAGLTSVR